MSRPEDVARIGIMTISDRASAGVYEDQGGPAVRAFLTGTLVSRWEAVQCVLPDDEPRIAAALVQWADVEGCDLVITTGGTGPAPRDVTPEATASVCSRLLPGFGEAMRATSLPKVPTAILSRAVAGIRGRTLIVNVPGNPKAVGECLSAVLPAIAHCLELIGARRVALREPVAHR